MPDLTTAKPFRGNDILCLYASVGGNAAKRVRLRLLEQGQSGIVTLSLADNLFTPVGQIVGTAARLASLPLKAG